MTNMVNDNGIKANRSMYDCSDLFKCFFFVIVRKRGMEKDEEEGGLV